MKTMGASMGVKDGDVSMAGEGAFGLTREVKGLETAVGSIARGGVAVGGVLARGGDMGGDRSGVVGVGGCIIGGVELEQWELTKATWEDGAGL
jgi:hypothetical protein